METLREAAEAALREQVAADAPEPLRRALHELLVHQVELEVQNEELGRAQLALEAQRARYVELYEQAPMGYCTVDEEELILTANAAAVAMLGLPCEELLRQRFTRFIHHDDQDSLYLLRLRLLKTGAPQSLELRIVKPGCEPVWVQLSANVAHAEGGIPVFRLGLSDISRIKLLEVELRIAATTFDSHEGVVITDAGKAILRTNKAFTRITGYAPEEVAGRQPSVLKSGRHDADFYASMWDSIAVSGSWQGEIWNRRKSGELYPEWLTITAVKDEAGNSSHYVGTFTDVSARKSAEDQIKALAFHDPLTQLPNRRLFTDRLEQALALGYRHQRKGALLFVDLDNFKNINDTLGHDQGDLLLKQVAWRLNSCVREGDTVARLGGDEFLVMLENLSDDSLDAARQAESVGEKIRLALARSYQLNHSEQRCSASIGITLFGGEPHESSAEPLKRADLAMYQAKLAGRNTLRFYDQEMQAVVTARSALEVGLHTALEQRQFVLHYQAQVSGQGQVTGAEALLRWVHPERGLLVPADFMSIAEDSGLILPLGQWVLEAACSQLAQWAQHAQSAHLMLTVNVSARQFNQKSFVDQVLATLVKTGANPRRLVLELTESLLLSHVDAVAAKMTALKAKGLGFSLDDFGTGFSSLAGLKRLPLDELKIDQGFVRNILTDPDDAAIARMVITLAQNFGLKVVAEGVETQEQRNHLASQGCNDWQGHLFSRPLAIQEFDHFLRSGLD